MWWISSGLSPPFTFLELCFSDTARANSTPLRVDNKLLLSFCPHCLSYLRTAARACMATPSPDLTLSSPFTAFSFWAPEGGSSSLKGFWDNSACVHLWAFFRDPTVSVQFINLSVEAFNIFRNIYFRMAQESSFIDRLELGVLPRAFILNKNLFSSIAHDSQKSPKNPQNC